MVEAYNVFMYNLINIRTIFDEIGLNFGLYYQFDSMAFDSMKL